MSSAFQTATELKQQLEKGDVSAREVVQQSIERIESLDSKLNAFLHVDGDTALEQADSIDRRRSAGEKLGPLAGIPIAVKDLICTKGTPTTCASKMLTGYRPPYDAHVIERLRAADAIVIGKTNMDEFAMGASTETSHFGVTRNPWDVTRTPGGSSGGAAACVAAGMVPLSLGSDTGGSIRQPAAFCGVTGLKPTYGRVSRYGLIAFASSLDQIGPLAPTARDCALVFDAIAGHDPRDSTSANKSCPDLFTTTESSDMNGITVGRLDPNQMPDGVPEEFIRSIDQAIEVCLQLGATIKTISLPHMNWWVPTYYVIAPAEASSNLSRFDGVHYGFRASQSENEQAAVGVKPTLDEVYLESRGQGFGPEVKRRIMIGTYALSHGYADKYYHQALKVRRLIANDFQAAFQDGVDVIVGPATPSTAFPLGEKIDDPVAMYLCDLFTVGANLAGIPAISVPNGVSKEGLPLAVQFQANQWNEAALLRTAAAFQTVVLPKTPSLA